MSRLAKFSITVACLAFASGVLSSHSMGTLWPALPIGAALASILLYLAFLRRPRIALAVGSFIALGVVYRLYSYQFAGSMIRNDPDAHAVRSQTIITNGDIGGLVESFYTRAPLFNIYGAQSSLVTGLPIDAAYAVFPLAVGILVPLLAVAITRRVSADPMASITAAAVSALGTSVVLFSIGPIPLMFSALIVGVFIIYLPTIHGRSGLSLRDVIILIVCLSIPAALTHKVAVLLTFGILLTFAFYTLLNTEIRDQQIEIGKAWIGLVLPIGILVAIQWIYLTDFFDSAILLILEIFGAIEIDPTAPEAAAAINATAPLHVRIWNVSHYLVSVALAGLVGVVLIRQNKDRDVRLLQAAAAATIVATLPGLVGSGPGFQRMFVFGFVFVAALLGVGYAWVSDVGGPTGRRVAVAAIVLVMLVNPLSAVAVPDATNTPREYLTEDEADAKQFAHDRVEDPLNEPVYQDVFYAQKTVDFERDAQDAAWHQATVPKPERHPGMLSQELLDGDLPGQEHQYISIRPNVDVYNLEGSRWRLTWDPDDELSRECHLIYSNPGANTYDCGDDSQ